MKWEIENIKFQLKYNWKLSRNETSEKVNQIIKITDNNIVSIGEVAPNIRYNETSESIILDFNKVLSNGLNNINNINEYKDFIQNIEISNSLKHGLESAITSYFLKKSNTSFYEYYQIDKLNSVETCFTIPIILPENIKSFYTDLKIDKYKYVKLKINNESAIDSIKELSKYTNQQPIVVDANEAWNDVEQLIIFLEKLHKFNIYLVEQPMPDYMVDEYIHLKKHSKHSIFADESIKSQKDLELISKQFHGINIKLMKSGGYTNAFEMLKEAQKFKLKTMLGCMVESTLGIYYSAQMASLFDIIDLDGHLLIHNEPFNILKTIDGKIYPVA